MAKISKKRLEKYRRLAEKGLWDLEHEGFNRFFSRAQEEGVELISNSFSTQGMFRAPHRKNLEGVDLAIVGVPLDLGVPNPRPGTRLGPEAVRYWSKDRNMINYHTEVVPFDLCSIIDWGDVEFVQDAFNLNACIDQLIRDYSVFKENNVVTLTIGGEHTITYAIATLTGVYTYTFFLDMDIPQLAKILISILCGAALIVFAAYLQRRRSAKPE